MTHMPKAALVILAIWFYAQWVEIGVAESDVHEMVRRPP